VEPLAYDPDRARQLIEEAGVTGFDFPIMAQNVEHIVQLAESVAADLQAVGINATPESTESGVWVDRLMSQDFMACTSASIGGLDPHTRTNPLNSSETSYNGYANPEVDDLLRQGLAEPDVIKRGQIYSQLWNILTEEARVIYMTAAPQVAAMRRHVKGFVPMPEQHIFCDKMWLDQ
jgi:peptide/nickel transport system substrate-binding protein